MGAALREQGHDVRLIAAQFIKPYRKSNKNDFIDAEAIAEAVTEENMRFAQKHQKFKHDTCPGSCVSTLAPLAPVSLSGPPP